jgi:hypothetical protein
VLNPEQKIKKMEREINAFIDESAILSVSELAQEALQKGKDAVQR